MRHRLCSGLLILLFSTVVAAAQDRAFFWKVSSEQADIYLLGSIHFANESFYPLRSIITEHFDKAERLAVEVVLADIDPGEYVSLVTRYGTYPQDTSLRSHIAPHTYQRLRDSLKRYGMPESSMDQIRPGMIIMQLASMMMLRNGYTPQMGIDMTLMQRAMATGKPIEALETIEQQIRLIAGLPHHDLLLDETLDQLDDADDMIWQMEQAWKSGNDEAMLELMISDPESKNEDYKDINEVLLYGRNRGMLDKIETYLSGDRSIFVIVGAAHLLGEQGLIEMLEDAGYDVARL